MLLPLKATACLMLTVVLLCTVPSMGQSSTADVKGHPRYQGQYQPQEPTYGSYNKGGYAPEHDTYKPQYGPGPDAYKQPHGSDKGSYGRDEYSGYSEQPAGNSYKGDGYGHDEEHYNHKEQYGGEKYGGEQYSDKQYSGHHKDQHIVPICLQQIGDLAVIPPQNGALLLAEGTFRCCGPADDADICADNSTSYNNNNTSQYPHERSPYPSEELSYGEDADPSDFLRAIVPSPAAMCRVALLEIGCPEFAGETCFGRFQLNCTLSAPAAKCGCPLGDSNFLSFSTEGYGRQVLQHLAMCFAETANTPASPVSATAFTIQSKIKAVTVHDGLKEVKGAFEYFPSVENGVALEPPFGGVTFVKQGQMIIRLLQDK